MSAPFLGFWEHLPRPFFALAPLADVTDVAFRTFVLRHSRPDVLWTEFVAADGLCHPVGRARLLPDLRFDPAEQPIVAQIFTGSPENMYQVAKEIKALGFAGIDINMGCPVKKINKQGSGAACILNPENSQALIRAAIAGVSEDGHPIPVSVKTRLGFNTDIAEEWIGKLLECQPAAITIHGRTQKEMSDVPAHWDRIADVVRLARGTGTLIIGNGDVWNMAEARERVAQSGVDGIMFGRAVFGNPWLFDESVTSVSVEQRLAAALEHTRHFLSTFGGAKNFDILKKHYRAYVHGFNGAKDLRVAMMGGKNLEDIEEMVANFLATHESMRTEQIDLSIPAVKTSRE